MRIGVIGGTGLNSLAVASDGLDRDEMTPFGAASATPRVGRLGDHDVVFLARHGQPHSIAPHRVNYRANIWLLRELGVEAIVASFAVGGIAPNFATGDIVIPRQILDYTYGRAHSFADGEAGSLRHIDFTAPFDASLRDAMAATADGLRISRGIWHEGTYGVTQGPRLETAAEIDRMERDGCAIVGMTAMPEAGLARELGLPYVGVALVVNAAAGRGDEPLSSQAIVEVSKRGMVDVVVLLTRFVERLQ